MKKKTPTDKLEVSTTDIHELYHEAKAYVEKHELGAYIGKNNEPRFDELDESQTVDAEDVLMLGSYLALRKLINMHQNPDVDVHVVNQDNIHKLPKSVREAIIKALTEED